MNYNLDDITITKEEALSLGIDELNGLGLAHKDIYKSINKQILDLIDNGGELPWRKPWRDGYKHKGISYGPQNYVTGNPYRGANAFTMWLYNMKTKGESIYFLSKKQIADRGGKLLPDAQPILVWAFIKTEKTKVNKEGKEYTERSQGILSYYVYDLKHTEGVKPIKRKTIETDGKHEVIVAAQTIIDNMPKRPKIANDGGNRAFYSPSMDKVSMPVQKAFHTKEEYYSTLFHELSHSTGHKSRLGREFGGKFGSKLYAFEELIAEISSAYLCGVTNIDYYTLKNSAAYLKGWAKNLKSEIASDKTFLFRAILAATKAAKYIIGTTLDKHGEVVTEGKKTTVKTKKPTSAKPKKNKASASSSLPHATLLKINWHEGTGEFDNYEAKSWQDLHHKFERIYSEYKKDGGGGYDKVKVEIKWSNGKHIVDRVDVGDNGSDFNPLNEFVGDYLKKQTSVMYESNFNQGERDAVSWKDEVNTNNVTSEKPASNKKVKASVTEAINQLLTLPKYKQYGAMFLGMFYSIFKNTDHVESIEGKMKATMFKKYEYDLFEADSIDDDELTNVTLTDEGKAIIKGIEGRLNTLKAKKAGTDMFPEMAGIVASKPSEIEFKTYTNDHGTFTSAAYKYGTIFKRNDGTFYYKTGAWPKVTHNSKTLKQAIAALDKFASEKEGGVSGLSPTIQFIRRYIAFDGRTVKMSEIAEYIDELQKAIKSKKIRKTDPNAESIREIQRKLVKLYNDNIKEHALILNISDREKHEEALKGLGFIPEMMAAAAGAMVQKLTHKHLKKSPEELAGLGCSCETRKPEGSPELKPQINCDFSGVMSADKMGEVSYESFDFNPYYKSILGKPATNFDLCIYGDPGSGKTVFLLKLANYFAENFGPVLYVSTEEYGAATLIDKIKRFKTDSKNLFFSPKLIDDKIDLSKYKFIFIDSVNHAKINLEQYKQIREKNPNTVFILILQTTKAGSYRGGKDWPHEVEISMKLYKDETGKRMLNVDKDRYANPRVVKI